MTETKTLKAGRTDYAVAAANIETREGATKGHFVANVNKDPKRSWRMVYDDKKIIALIDSDGYTYTIYNLFCAETKDECVAKSKSLGMEIPVDPVEVQPK